MIHIDDHATIGGTLTRAAEKYTDNALLVAPANPNRNYYPEGKTFSFAMVEQQACQLAERYQKAGYGYPHRIGLFLASRPEHMLHKLAMNRPRSEEHTSELQSRGQLVCRLLLEKK